MLPRCSIPGPPSDDCEAGAELDASVVDDAELGRVEHGEIGDGPVVVRVGWNDEQDGAEVADEGLAGEQGLADDEKVLEVDDGTLYGRDFGSRYSRSSPSSLTNFRCPPLPSLPTTVDDENALAAAAAEEEVLRPLLVVKDHRNNVLSVDSKHDDLYCSHIDPVLHAHDRARDHGHDLQGPAANAETVATTSTSSTSSSSTVEVDAAEDDAPHNDHGLMLSDGDGEIHDSSQQHWQHC
ncbi:hypothetical protein AAF712_006928 [Marasmius tenuissimus]|uniref:Uncharacterized protein n=1 Tax=Marasmius tenuissimus TaxID=585030 RepID=A0ABR2ZWJ0_9AGAR